MQISYNWLKDYCEHNLSPRELAESLSHAGLCVETYEPRGNDWMLDVEVTSNRPDCLSHLGVAREVAALTGSKTAPPPGETGRTVGRAAEKSVAVEVTCPELCPHYTARVIRNVKVAPSPQWLQTRLITCGLRPVNNIVDITNYVLLESGQPMHAFDLERVTERRLIIRRATEGEQIIAIDGTQCMLSDRMCVIADAARPVAVAGVMGGLESEISETTSCVLLESARFNPVNIRRTSRSLGLSSDSSYRFERGVDPENVEAASVRAAEMIAELAGGEIAPGLLDIRFDSPAVSDVKLRMHRIREVLGISIELEEINAIFGGLGLSVTDSSSNTLAVQIPSWRPDLTREIDLIEEIARIHGYDKIAETTRIPVATAPLSKHEICTRKIKKMLAGQGFDEVITSSLVAPSPIQTAQPWYDGAPIAVRNPVSSDKTHLRLTVMGNLISAKRHNQAHGVDRVDLFETGKVYIPSDPDLAERPEEKRCLALLTDRPDGFFVLKGILQNLSAILHLKSGSIAESDGKKLLFEKDRVLYFSIDERPLGCVGVLDAKAAGDMDFNSGPALMELDMDFLIDCAAIEPELRPLPKYPAVKRDIAVVVDEGVRWSDIESCVRNNPPKELEAVDFLDLYRGKQVPEGKKSIAFSISFRAPQRTLRSEEADSFRDAIVAALAETHGARLRGQ